MRIAVLDTFNYLVLLFAISMYSYDIVGPTISKKEQHDNELCMLTMSTGAYSWECTSYVYVKALP